MVMMMMMGAGGAHASQPQLKSGCSEFSVCRTQHFLPICDLNISDDINVTTHKQALVKRGNI